ncbi:MAG TPA: ABC transporter permease [Anaerolineales bacterium]|nr:ABC transporter permease [Anaerolineales bacterium]
MFKFLIRISSFLRKELVEIFRQPRLILTLVLGPFLIMFLFGLGYPEQSRPLRTVFVMEEQNAGQEQVNLFTESPNPVIINQGVETSEASAMARLARNQADLVVIVPPNPVETIQSNQQAVFTVYHNEVDPFQIAYIQSVVRIYVDEINRRALQTVTEEGQAEAGSVQPSLETALERVRTLRAAIPPGDTSTATQLAELEAELTAVNENLTTFRSMGSGVIVSPFTSQTSGLSDVEFTPTGFFAPSVIVLILQHISVTFAALSIVRERRSGIMELFRVSPMTAFESLLGKFLSYLFFEIVLAAVITALAVWVLGIPMLGEWKEYAAAIAILIFTSLGLGFMISLVSETDTQAVQFSMLVLLASIFFSGFILDLRLMWDPIKAVAWSIPATYGIRLLQDIMLRGNLSQAIVLQGLALIGVGLFLIDWLLLRRNMEA